LQRDTCTGWRLPLARWESKKRRSQAVGIGIKNSSILRIFDSPGEAPVRDPDCSVTRVRAGGFRWRVGNRRSEESKSGRWHRDPKTL
jgi:hypothetical protein